MDIDHGRMALPLLPTFATIIKNLFSLFQLFAAPNRSPHSAMTSKGTKFSLLGILNNLRHRRAGHLLAHIDDVKLWADSTCPFWALAHLPTPLKIDPSVSISPRNIHDLP